MPNFFKLIETLETDLQYPDDEFSVRIEIFQSTQEMNKFRARVWRLDTFNLEPCFPGKAYGEAIQSMETIMVDWSTSLSSDLSDDYAAESKEEFTTHVLTLIEEYRLKFPEDQN